MHSIIIIVQFRLIAYVHSSGAIKYFQGRNQHIGTGSWPDGIFAEITPPLPRARLAVKDAEHMAADVM
jgi:hypothetical protein